MKQRDFAGLMAAAAPHLTGEQRVLVARFVGALAGSSTSARTDAHRSRREAERRWEEQQLQGCELACRRREPA